MDTEEYKLRLVAEEQQLQHGIEEARSDALNGDSSTGDAADASVSDNSKEEQFRVADSDSTLLRQVREALQRIENGTFGKCIVDGGPIEEKRLNATPWTPYCRKHQEALEALQPLSTPTL